jgi:hypothetical protein
MDAKNPFESPTTYRLHRAEYLVAWVAVSILIVLHWSDIRLLPAIVLFVYIDLIGYLPGAIAFRRSPDGRISKNYYLAYNIMHSMVTQGAVIVIWGFTIGWEWALLAIPWHLFADRGVYGNFLKPFGLPFEPHAAPGYRRLIDEISGGTPAVTGDRAPEAASVPGT